MQVATCRLLYTGCLQHLSVPASASHDTPLLCRPCINGKCILVSQQGVAILYGVQIWCQNFVSETWVWNWCQNLVSQSDVTIWWHNLVSESLSHSGFRVSRHTLASKPFAFACNKFSSYLLCCKIFFFYAEPGRLQVASCITVLCHDQCPLPW